MRAPHPLWIRTEGGNKPKDGKQTHAPIAPRNFGSGIDRNRRRGGRPISLACAVKGEKFVGRSMGKKRTASSLLGGVTSSTLRYGRKWHHVAAAED